MKTAVIIPARYKSSRFPGKPLVEILGKPLICRVAEICEKAHPAKDVYVATDDERIRDVAMAAGHNAVMTRDDHPTGTDRLAEVSTKIDADIYINVQGDEPLIEPQDIKDVIDAKKSEPDHIIQAYCKVSVDEDPSSTNIPKIIFSEDGEFVYCSRSLIPGSKDSAQSNKHYFKQVCIYGFNATQLQSFANFGRKSRLEEIEDIEVLRFLELGIPIRMKPVSSSSLAVDVPADVARVESALRKRGIT